MHVSLRQGDEMILRPKNVHFRELVKSIGNGTGQEDSRANTFIDNHRV